MRCNEAQKLRYGTGKGAFLSGFVSSGFSVGAGEGYKGAFAMVIVGGTVSEIGGGKFSNGAMASAFQFLLNDSFSDMMARKSAFPSEKTRAESAKTANEFLGKMQTTFGFMSSGAAVKGNLIAASYFGTISLVSGGLKYLGDIMSSNFDGQEFVVDVVLDQTKYVKNPLIDSMYDEVFGTMSEHMDDR